MPIPSPPPSTDIDKTAGDGCFLTLLDWLSRVRGEEKRANRGLNQSTGDILMHADALNETEFLAELLYDELYDTDRMGDGKIETDIGEEHKIGERGIFGKGSESESSVRHVDSCGVTVDGTYTDSEVDFILGDNDKSRTPLSILKAEVLEFGNENKKTPLQSKNFKKTIVPETPIFEQISVDSFHTSRTPLLDGLSPNSGIDHEISDLSDKNEVRKLDFSNMDEMNDEVRLLRPEVSEDGSADEELNNSATQSDSNKCSATSVTDTTSVDKNIVNIETDNQKTPLKSLENLPPHQTSPFMKKLATDKVTKRKSRRKRQLDSCGDSSYGSDLSDAKELCQGLSPPASQGSNEIKVHTDLLGLPENVKSVI